MLYLLIFSWVTYALDWSSTIEAHDCRVEENPFMRGIWCDYGDLGFTLVSIAFAILSHICIVVGMKYGIRVFIVPPIISVIGLKFLIALTNLAVIPYWVTSWWQY